MRRVLLAVDGSDCSLKAVRYLIEKRANYRDPDGLEIHLVNVQAPLSGDVAHYFPHSEVEGFHRDQSTKALEGARALLDEAGAQYTVHAEVGNVAEMITKLADTLQCDQIMMGSHGRSALAEFLMGSTTIRVLHLAKVPVLLVK